MHRSPLKFISVFFVVLKGHLVTLDVLYRTVMFNHFDSLIFLEQLNLLSYHPLNLNIVVSALQKCLIEPLTSLPPGHRILHVIVTSEVLDCLHVCLLLLLILVSTV